LARLQINPENDRVISFQEKPDGDLNWVNALEAIRHTPSVRAAVNMTTDKSYDNKEWLWGYREDEPMGGYDPYSNSKGCSELVTASFRNSFFNASEYGKTHQVALATARAGNVIGGGDWAENRLIPDFVRSVQRNEKVMIRSPYSIRPWQHVLEPLATPTARSYLFKIGLLQSEGATWLASGVEH